MSNRTVLPARLGPPGTKLPLLPLLVSAAADPLPEALLALLLLLLEQAARAAPAAKASAANRTGARHCRDCPRLMKPVISHFPPTGDAARDMCRNAGPCGPEKAPGERGCLPGLSP